MKLTQLVCGAWICFLLCLPLTAQEALWLHLTPPLLTQDSLPNTGFYISRVLDGRPAYMQTGFIQRENKYVKVQLFFPEGIEKHIYTFLAARLPARSNDQPVVIRINRLFVGEYATDSSTMEMGTAAVEMDFLAEKPDGLSLLFQAFALVKKEGVNAVELHNDNLQEALQACMAQFCQKKGNSPATTSIPYIQPPMRGMYRSFVEWQLNQPSGKDPFDMKKKSYSLKNKYDHKTTIHYTTPGQEKEPVENMWGFSDGERTYIYFQREYWPLRPVKGGCLFTAYTFIDDNKIAAEMLEKGVAAPFMGIAYVNRKQTYFLDARTGQITEAHPSMDVQEESAYTAATASPTTNLTIYYKASRKTAPSRSVQVIFSSKQDTLVADLRPNSFVSIPWKNAKTEVVVCIKGSKASCFTFVPSFTHANYLEYIPSADAEDVVIHPVPGRDAVLTLRQIGQEEGMGNKAER